MNPFDYMSIFDTDESKSELKRKKETMLQNDWDVEFFVSVWDKTEEQISAKRQKSTKDDQMMSSKSDETNDGLKTEKRKEFRHDKILKVLGDYQKQSPHLLKLVGTMDLEFSKFQKQMREEEEKLQSILDKLSSL